MHLWPLNTLYDDVESRIKWIPNGFRKGAWGGHAVFSSAVRVAIPPFVGFFEGGPVPGKTGPTYDNYRQMLGC